MNEESDREVYGVKGGQGRSPESIIESASAIAVVFVVFVIALVAFLVEAII